MAEVAKAGRALTACSIRTVLPRGRGPPNSRYETAPTPRFASQFYREVCGRLVYGTNMGFDVKMYQITFRILESEDEHFYEIEQFSYHWPLHGRGWAMRFGGRSITRMRPSF